MPQNLLYEELTHSVIGEFFRVYNAMGYGFLEHLYVMALERRLRAKGHRVAREMVVNVHFEGELLGQQRVDMVVDDSLVLEVKSSAKLAPEARRQLYNYLKATSLEVGLLLHFSPEGAKFYREIHSTDRKQFLPNQLNRSNLVDP